METETSKKQHKAVDPVSRFMWALAFPGVSPVARLVLAALAYHADQRKLTCFPSVATLARETQADRRTVQTALRQLEVAGAILTERSRGRTSSLYRLMIPLNRGDSPPSNRAVPAPNRGESPLLTAANHRPNRGESPLFNRGESPPQQSYSLEQSKEQQQQQPLRARKTHDLATTTPAAAAPPHSSTNTQTARHTCPTCENTWPKKFGPTCFKCQFDVERAQRHEETQAETEEAERRWDEDHPPAPPAPPVSQTARTLNGCTGGRLPESWLHHQDLKTLMARRDFRELCDIVGGIRASKLPAPDAFFADYGQHLQEHQRGEAELKAMNEAAA